MFDSYFIHAVLFIECTNFGRSVLICINEHIPSRMVYRTQLDEICLFVYNSEMKLLLVIESPREEKTLGARSGAMTAR